MESLSIHNGMWWQSGYIWGENFVLWDDHSVEVKLMNWDLVALMKMTVARMVTAVTHLQSGLRSTWISLCGWSISQLDFNICSIRGIRKTAVGSLERCNLESGIQTTRESLNSHSALAHVWPENISGVWLKHHFFLLNTTVFEPNLAQILKFRRTNLGGEWC